MQPTITSEVVVAYAQCPRKAYLLLFSPDSGEPHEYECILAERTRTQRLAYLNTLRQAREHVQVYDPNAVVDDRTVLVDVRLTSPGVEASCDALIPMPMAQARHTPGYRPTMVVGTHTITEEQILACRWVSAMLGQLQQTAPVVGTLVDAGGQRHHIKLGPLSPPLSMSLSRLHQWLDTRPEIPPSIILNKACPSCSFRQLCHQQAEAEDNLSLLDHMTPKMMQRYHRNGIFTVHQLSYVFKPRRGRKRAKKPPVHFNVELQALAIRTEKIYVYELPDLPRHPVELFLDIEGIPDQRFHYLLGLLICTGEHSTYHALWADTLHDEVRIWHELLAIMQQYPAAPIYHYGSYEPKAIAQLSKRHETPSGGVMQRLVNVNAFIYGKLYFPVRSNTLKDLGRYVGASWTVPEASGLHSLVWRYRWEETREEIYKARLLTYNEEDCQALLILARYLTMLQASVETPLHVDFADRPKRQTTERGEDIHRTFDAILKSAHAQYTSRRIHLRPAPGTDSREPKKRGAKPGHQAYQRLLPTHAGTVIRVPPRRTCPKHPGTPLHRGEAQVEKPIIDLHFTPSGCRKTVTMYVGKQGYCAQCEKYYDPRGIEQFEGQVFGHAFQAWVIYQRLVLRLPYRVIVQAMEDRFGERASIGTLIKFIKRFAQYYAPTERLLRQRLLQSPFVHVDETLLTIEGTKQYVWVFTDGTHVLFKMTATREATIVHEVLAHYTGILVSDFYAGYDALPCRQQKCLVHLIRDLNDDLWASPFNPVFESFVVAVQNLLVPIFEAMVQYGSKRWHLQKFHPTIDRFYQQHIANKVYTCETTTKYQKRFQRYRNSLFTFLDQDGLPWHNNTAERALRHLAVQRKISGAFGERVAPPFLLLLGIAQTCRFQGKSFLKFLLSKEYDVDAFKTPKRVQVSRPVGPAREHDCTGRVTMPVLLSCRCAETPDVSQRSPPWMHPGCRDLMRRCPGSGSVSPRPAKAAGTCSTFCAWLCVGDR